LLEAVARGLQAAEIFRPHNHRRGDRLQSRLDLLRTWRKNIGQEARVESDVILPRDELEAIALADPQNLDELSPLMAHLPWRFETYGNQILAAMHPRKKDENQL
jgi:ribonuclease D